MMDKLYFFTTDEAGEHPGRTYIRNLVPMPFRKRMGLLITSIWNGCLFYFIAWLHIHVKKYFAGPEFIVVLKVY